MAGSKRGERRGAAKGGQSRIAKNPRGRPKTRKSQLDPEIRQILLKSSGSKETERKLEDYFLITGKRMRMPRDVMIDAMRYFEETALEYHDVLQQNLQLAAQAETPEQREVFEQGVAYAETRMRESLSLAVDVAYKAAPFCHPRLAAVVTNPGSGGDGPLNVLALLMQDLDEAGKPPRYIDHNPQEPMRSQAAE